MSQGIEAELDSLAGLLASEAPFDISPRGIGFRPGPEIRRRIESVCRRNDDTIRRLAARLRASDPFESVLWISCLRQIPSHEATLAIDGFLQDLRDSGRWAEQFPGQREIELFAGGSEPL